MKVLRLMRSLYLWWGGWFEEGGGIAGAGYEVVWRNQSPPEGKGKGKGHVC